LTYHKAADSLKQVKSIDDAIQRMKQKLGNNLSLSDAA
jgi:hypothetical protein